MENGNPKKRELGGDEDPKTMSAQKEFIDWLTPYARTVEDKYGILSSAMISQAALETGWGEHITKDYHTEETSNNLFNLKDTEHDMWHSGYVEAETAEWFTRPEIEVARAERKLTRETPIVYGDKRKVYILARFRKYPTPGESFQDYATLISMARRYKKAYAARGDFREYFNAILEAGYATDPEYINKIISIGEMYFNI